MNNSNILHFAQSFKPDPNGNHYYIPENINLNEVKLGYRNRGDYKPLKSKGLIVTTYGNPGGQSFYDLKENTPSSPTKNGNWNTGYVGVDAQGKFILGNYQTDKNIIRDQIKRGGKVATAPYFRVYDIPKQKGQYVLTKNPGISGSRYTVTLNADYGQNTARRNMPFNIMLGRNKETNTYGDITGGRVIMKCGDEVRLVSGSMDNIYSVFNDMKQRHKSQYVEFYQLDNGTFNKGIRTKNGILDENTLRMYDEQNTDDSAGGGGLYLR